MSPDFRFEESFIDAPADELVSFSVVCQPRSGASVDSMRGELSLKTLEGFLPTDAERARVVSELKRRGFEVFDSASPVVSARGTVRLFESVFGGRLAMKIRRRIGPERTHAVTSIVLRRDSAPPSAAGIPGAALVAVAEKPDPSTPSLPPAVNGLHLRVPGDIAQLTRASATHRLSTARGQRATGAGVAVAVVDGGFAEHPYYSEHGYHITRVAASDTSDPDHDPEPHGTCILAGLFACAPDAEVFAIKYGDNSVLALDKAMEQPGVRVISLSWGYDLKGEKTLPTSPVDLLPLQLRILTIISGGVTVMASAGNGQMSFPGMMPEVVAVGGVDVDAADALAAWSGGSSYVSAIFKGRGVPDLCGVAARALLPVPGIPADPGPPRVPASPPGWESMQGGTSLATCQMAGVAALLLQKNATLTPQTVRTALTTTSTDVVAGTSFFGDPAGPGPDLATGSGFVNALKAWNSV